MLSKRIYVLGSILQIGFSYFQLFFMTLCRHLFRSRGDSLWFFGVNVNKIFAQRKKIGNTRNLFASKIEGQISENIAAKIRCNTIALRIHFPRLLFHGLIPIWFRNFMEFYQWHPDEMNNAKCVLRLFKLLETYLFSNCFNSTSISKYQAVYTNNLSWFLQNLLTRKCKGLRLQRALFHKSFCKILSENIICTECRLVGM